MIYLDYAANTPVSSEVLAVFEESTRKYIANPNASHRLGRLAKEKINEATAQIATLLGVSPSEIIYTSGATEANNLAIKGICEQYKRYGKHIITTYLEHSSVTSPIVGLQNSGFEVDFVDILPNGQIDLEHLKELIRPDTILISISYVDSELGGIQPIDAISQIVKTYKHCYLHVDATQAIGKVPVNLSTAHLITFAPHKFYGMNGIGILIKKEGILLKPLIEGGVSTTTYRSGSPTLALIVSSVTALELAIKNLDIHYEKVQAYNTTLRKTLSCYKWLQINSDVSGSPYILNMSLKGVNAGVLQEQLEAQDIFIATKSACCTLNTPSRPVYAVTKDKKLALSTLRISLSHLTTEDEINTFLASFKASYESLTK